MGTKIMDRFPFSLSLFSSFPTMKTCNKNKDRNSILPISLIFMYKDFSARCYLRFNGRQK